MTYPRDGWSTVWSGYIPPGPAHQDFYRQPAIYKSMLPPTPWIFRGDVNKPFFVLLAMEAIPLAIAIIMSLI